MLGVYQQANLCGFCLRSLTVKIYSPDLPEGPTRMSAIRVVHFGRSSDSLLMKGATDQHVLYGVPASQGWRAFFCKRKANYPDSLAKTITPGTLLSVVMEKGSVPGFSSCAPMLGTNSEENLKKCGLPEGRSARIACSGRVRGSSRDLSFA